MGNLVRAGFFSRDLCFHVIIFLLSNAFICLLNMGNIFGTGRVREHQDVFCKVTSPLSKVKWSTPKQVTLLICLPGPGGPYRTHYLHARFGIGHKHRRAVKLKNEMLKMFYKRYLSCYPG